jgi:purine nucleosidase
MKLCIVALAALAAAACARIETVVAELPPMTQGPSIWIDTDAACGVGFATDVDDCLALFALTRHYEHGIVAISTTYGNASREKVDLVLGELAPLWSEEFGSVPIFISGARHRGDCQRNEAAFALRRALKRQPATIVALGPLTNVACALAAEPAIANRIERLIFVGGARPGHVFHPADGAPGAILFGHGPIARDLNVQLDPEAVKAVLASGIPITLTPYDLATQTSLGEDAIDRFSLNGALASEIAIRARPWLRTWRTMVGREGFYPFDLMAAVAVVTPEALACADVPARVAADRAISGNRFGPERLLVGPVAFQTGEARNVQWCDRLITHSAPFDLLGIAS